MLALFRAYCQWLRIQRLCSGSTSLLCRKAAQEMCAACHTLLRLWAVHTELWLFHTAHLDWHFSRVSPCNKANGMLGSHLTGIYVYLSAQLGNTGQHFLQDLHWSTLQIGYLETYLQQLHHIGCRTSYSIYIGVLTYWLHWVCHLQHLQQWHHRKRWHSIYTGVPRMLVTFSSSYQFYSNYVTGIRKVILHYSIYIELFYPDNTWTGLGAKHCIFRALTSQNCDRD